MAKTLRPAPSISWIRDVNSCGTRTRSAGSKSFHISRSEEHTSELQSLSNLVCRLLLEKQNSSLGLAPLGIVGRLPSKFGCIASYAQPGDDQAVPTLASSATRSTKLRLLRVGQPP